MLNIEEIVIYIIIILGLICMVQIYNNMNPKINPIWEGLTNPDTTTTTTKKPDKKEAVVGLNSGAVEYNQDIVGLISVGEIELNVNKYSDEYITVLKNLKSLYLQKMLKILLKIDTNDPMALPIGNDRYSVAVYDGFIKYIDVVLQNLSNPQQSITQNTNSGGGGGGNQDTNKSSSWGSW